MITCRFISKVIVRVHCTNELCQSEAVNCNTLRYRLATDRLKYHQSELLS